MTTGLLIVLLYTDQILQQGKDKLFESQFNLSQFNK